MRLPKSQEIQDGAKQVNYQVITISMIYLQITKQEEEMYVQVQDVNMDGYMIEQIHHVQHMDV